jgi:RNA polymerase sigma factor (sigma-70 family)
MATTNEFSELIGRIRRGDADAACEIVRQYEMAIRVAIRTRLSDPRLRRHFDSMDICQSVLASFFLRAATGAFDLNDPRQLVALLMKMAEKKLAMHARAHFRQCRDLRRSSPENNQCATIASGWPDAARHAIGKELLNRALEMMNEDERTIARHRVRGETWADIASAMGGSAEARRKQYERAVEVIADRLDLECIEG